MADNLTLYWQKRRAAGAAKRQPPASPPIIKPSDGLPHIDPRILQGGSQSCAVPGPWNDGYKASSWRIRKR